MKEKLTNSVRLVCCPSKQVKAGRTYKILNKTDSFHIYFLAV
jgi:hypothetical protein